MLALNLLYSRETFQAIDRVEVLNARRINQEELYGSIRVSLLSSLSLQRRILSAFHPVTVVLVIPAQKRHPRLEQGRDPDNELDPVRDRTREKVEVRSGWRKREYGQLSLECYARHGFEGRCHLFESAEVPVAAAMAIGQNPLMGASNEAERG